MIHVSLIKHFRAPWLAAADTLDVSFLILSIFNQTNLAQNEGTCFGNVTEGEGTASVSSCLLLHVSVRDLVLSGFFVFFLQLSAPPYKH